jgi:hypothetical protein
VVEYTCAGKAAVAVGSGPGDGCIIIWGFSHISKKHESQSSPRTLEVLVPLDIYAETSLNDQALFLLGFGCKRKACRVQ